MYIIDFQKPVNVHFIGIGGISMSALAEILLRQGFKITGSDSSESELTGHLNSIGARVFLGQRASNIPDDAQLVVYTAAVKKDNPELMEAISRGLPVITRAQLLGQIMKNYDIPIAVAGTHGKTTTTSMLAHMLMEAGLDPTVTVGGVFPAIGGNFRMGDSEYFIAEACEYTNSFLSFFPRIEIILNVEADHLDFFKDIDEIYDSFGRFAELTPKDGCLVINHDTADRIAKDLSCKCITFSMDDRGDYYPGAIEFDDMNRGSFDVYEHGEKIGRFKLAIPGMHNISNSLSVIALGRYFGVSIEVMQKALATFEGANRRFQYKGEISGVRIIDDYAHHPTEIAATLTSARQCRHNQIWCVFQPHTYTRTKALFDDFAKSLALSDKVVLVDIYAAREENTVGISSGDLAEKIKELGTDVWYLPTFDAAENFLLENCINGDLLITMGAGDVVKIGEKLLGNI